MTTPQNNPTVEKKLGIGFLRQWLNEDRITDPKKMVTNEDILTFIDDPKTLLQAEREKLVGEIEKLKPEDTEAKGWDIIEEHLGESCCPGDDAGMGYEVAISDIITLIRDKK